MPFTVLVDFGVPLSLFGRDGSWRSVKVPLYAGTTAVMIAGRCVGSAVDSIRLYTKGQHGFGQVKGGYNLYFLQIPFVAESEAHGREDRIVEEYGSLKKGLYVYVCMYP